RRWSYFLCHYTDDVIFDEACLATLCNITDSQSDMRRYRLEALFNNAMPAGQLFQPYIYFDARKRTMRCDVGLRNADLVAMMPPDSGPSFSISSTVRNWFQLLGHGGDRADQHDIIRMYRGQFTPEFYPMRFLAKDCIYRQRPEVLGILLNTVLARYARAG